MNFDNYVDAVSKIDLFSDFSKDELYSAFDSSKYRISRYDKGQIIHLQNEQCNSMGIILDGRVSVQKIDENGSILKISVFLGGDILGANLIFSNRNFYPMTVVAESKSVVLHLYKELILELSQKNVGFMIRLMTAISDRTLVLTDKIDAISFKSIRQRVLDYLKYECYLQKSNTITPGISKKDFADRLGVQRTSLSRELNKMKKDGLIEYNARTITLKDYRSRGEI
ncbi:MAG: Crp/Fnr family transcriptional regulator [Eubacteriales bacterium]|nr:Crp/Fnr family transcriptional regulator [Eubacteriales bacterium]